MFYFGGGKCTNLGVVNVRVLGVVNVLLANDSQSNQIGYQRPLGYAAMVLPTSFIHVRWEVFLLIGQLVH